MRSLPARVLSIALVLIAIIAMGAAPAFAVSTGSGYWYWPTGTESFGGMSPWWTPRGSGHHLAQDMKASCGSPVYAVGDGTVLESKYVTGYGPGGGKGGAVVILHTTAAGKQFKALYGHLSGLRYARGDTVKAGAVIGTINNSNPNHLHFGIHPGKAYPRDGNPFRGHSYNSYDTYGFVNPVTYLRSNPRIIPYVAPPLPTVASFTTTSTPFALGATDGVVYWQDVSDETTRAWSYSILGSRLKERSFDSTPPAFDNKRYVVKKLATGFTVQDRKPKISAAFSDSTPARGNSALLKGRVLSAAGKPFKGARLTVERKGSTGWTTYAHVIADSTGAYSYSKAFSSRTHLRVRFAPPSTFIGAVSCTATVLPHAALSKPALSTSSPVRNRAFTVTSYLTPSHSKATVLLLLDRYVGGKWVRVADKRAYTYQVTGRTRCKAYFSLSKAGKYRVRAYTAEDSGHATTCSAATVFSVR